jgi:hypothetical protein
MEEWFQVPRKVLVLVDRLPDNIKRLGKERLVLAVPYLVLRRDATSARLPPEQDVGRFLTALLDDAGRLPEVELVGLDRIDD